MKSTKYSVSTAVEIVRKLVDALTNAPVCRVSILSELERLFRAAGWPEIQAAVLAESSLELAMERLERSLEVWDADLIPRPLAFGNYTSVVKGINDPDYGGGLKAHYFDILRVVAESNERELLGIGALYCAALSCDRIFITDRGGGDAGVDVLARAENHGAIGHTIIAVQCKAAKNPVTRLEVEHIASRFSSGMSETRWDEYRRVTEARELRQSPGVVFAILASRGLAPSGVDRAVVRGVMASSPRQVAFALSDRWTTSQIVDFCANVPRNRDLTRNLANEIPSIATDMII